MVKSIVTIDGLHIRVVADTWECILFFQMFLGFFFFFANLDMNDSYENPKDTYQ